MQKFPARSQKTDSRSSTRQGEPQNTGDYFHWRAELCNAVGRRITFVSNSRASMQTEMFPSPFAFGFPFLLD